MGFAYSVFFVLWVKAQLHFPSQLLCLEANLFRTRHVMPFDLDVGNMGVMRVE